MSSFVAVWAAFELFVFGTRHDFIMADILPFSQSRLSNQYFFIAKMVASYSYFSLAILDLERQIEESKFPRTVWSVLLLLYLFWKSLDQEKVK